MAFVYRPPADVGDFDRRPALAAQLRAGWHEQIRSRVAERAGGLFYDAANDPAPELPAARAPIPWNAFPRSIWQWFRAEADPAGPARALASADLPRPFTWVIRGGQLRMTSAPGARPARRVTNGALGATIRFQHRQHDEYCEWHVERNAAGGIRRLSFTAEGPEYWEYVARQAPDLLLELYRELASPDVRRADLFWSTPIAVWNEDRGAYSIAFERGDYNPYNKWNTTHGAVHLTHPANTLGAEINLAADATVLRPGVSLAPAETLPFRLVCCGIPAGVNRSSDPLICAGVNGFCRQGRSVTLADPVGLYMSEIDVDGLRAPDGAPIGAQALRVVRASADGALILRAELRVPAGANYTLDQCRLEGAPLAFGGQVARKITMVLFGAAKQVPGRVGRSAACTSKCCGKPGAPDFLGVFGLNQNCATVDPAAFDGEAPVAAGAPQQTPKLRPKAAQAAAEAPSLALDEPRPTRPATRG